jgi:hypothetical protein
MILPISISQNHRSRTNYHLQSVDQALKGTDIYYVDGENHLFSQKKTIDFSFTPSPVVNKNRPKTNQREADIAEADVVEEKNPD